MSDEKDQKPEGNKNLLIIFGVVLVAVAVGVFVYLQQNDKSTATLEIGGKSITATFDN